MLLKEAIELHKKHNGKTDILELLGIELRDNYLEEEYYKNKLNTLEPGDYFISDLDGTFFRGMLSQETFSLFFKYIKRQNLLNYDAGEFKEFLEDNKFFDKLERDSYNKKIKYGEYINAGTFLLFKYKRLIKWDSFINYLKESFVRKEKVNPFRFSIRKIKDVLNAGNKFVFVSGAPHFVLEIYVQLLKEHLKEDINQKYLNNIEGFGSYMKVNNSHALGLFGKDQKDNFIKLLKKTGKVKKIIGGMGDTKSDYGISYNLEEGETFYFVNPEQSVIENYDKLKTDSVKYRFIIERKNLIFEINPKDVNILDIEV
ncbi:MAG: hypothetical protein PHH06_05225 [Candidatus Gracilibacteria bacterium]|nr:hypothetical protein [Candidatus Gracilibacteria bacterium]